MFNINTYQGQYIHCLNYRIPIKQYHETLLYNTCIKKTTYTTNKHKIYLDSFYHSKIYNNIYRKFLDKKKFKMSLFGKINFRFSKFLHTGEFFNLKDLFQYYGFHFISKYIL